MLKKRAKVELVFLMGSASFRLCTNRDNAHNQYNNNIKYEN